MGLENLTFCFIGNVSRKKRMGVPKTSNRHKKTKKIAAYIARNERIA